MSTNRPAHIIIADADGTPGAIIDVDQLEKDALKFMFELCATAGDDPATDKVWEKWVTTREPDEFGYLTAAVLPMMLSNVLAPALDVAKEITGRDFRDKLRELSKEAGEAL
ncbi:hypothetical protein ACWFOS_13640 [Gordonia terrae]